MLHEISLPQAAETVQRVCRDFPVSLAYVFGSYARGDADAESDLDIAVLAAEALSPRGRHLLKLQLMQALAAGLRLDSSDVDVVVLQDAPLLLQLNVLRRSMVVLETEVGNRSRFEREVRRRYELNRRRLDRESARTLRDLVTASR